MSPSLDLRETRAHAYELKFVVPDAVARRIRDWARAELRPDPYGTGHGGDEYLTTSLYFDTPAFDVLRRQRSYGRMKFRARRYGASHEIFLERKLRNSRMLNKRRTTVPLADLARVTSGSGAREWPGAWFQRRLGIRSLRPVVQISYARTARVGDGLYGSIRLTVDDDIRALPIDSCAFRAERGTRLLDGHQIVELKYRVMLPAVFKRLIEEFQLDPLPVSKYRLGAAVLPFRGELRPFVRPTGPMPASIASRGPSVLLAYPLASRLS